MDEDVVAKLTAAGLLKLAELYVVWSTERVGLVETGSSSIGVDLSESCTWIREHMKYQHGVHQNAEILNHVWAAIGDPSGILYFGGKYRKEDGSIGWITPAQYVEVLAFYAHQFPTKVVSDLEILAHSFFEFDQKILAGHWRALRFNDKHTPKDLPVQ